MIAPLPSAIQIGDTITLPARLSRAQMFLRWLHKIWFGQLPPKPMAEYRVTATSDDLIEYALYNSKRI